MKVVYNWLKDFVDVPASAEELASRLAQSGTNIGGVEHGKLGPVIHAEVTSNRPDCLGYLGVAREVSASFKLPLKFPATAQQATVPSGKGGEQIAVEIRSPELCGRYTARVLRGIKVQPSPAWLRDRLEAVGVASINNVVDATNYVMFELGNPLHAFDYDKVRDHKIVVRRARSGEKMTTLDGVERELEPNMPLVCDGDGDRAIGSGVMGGRDTEISFGTRNVLLECAHFDAVSIRRAARFLRLHSEASTRFGRGADAEMAETASRRCAELILQLAGGELAASVDVYPGKRPPKKIRLRRTEFLRTMGADVADKEVESTLGLLGFAPARVDEHRGAAGSLLATWECTQPSWRGDVEREIDLIEEVARIHGLDNFPPRLPAARTGAARLPQQEAETRLRERLIGLGYAEIVTIPHVSAERDELFRPPGVAPARISNPLSEEAALLRSTGVVSMLGALEWNLNHGQRNARLFEIARHYRLDGDKSVETPVLTLGVTGQAREQGIHDSAREFSFADLKGDIDSLGHLAGGIAWHPLAEASDGIAWLNAARRGHILLHREQLGVGGQLARRVADRVKIRQEVFLAELRLEPFYRGYAAAKHARRYEPLPRFPAVERDFSLLLPEGTHFSRVAGAIQSLGIAELSSVEAADLFRGKNVPAGKYSLLIRVKFQSHEATLTDVQIGDYAEKIVSALTRGVGAQLRAQ
jgi:phenylalanyl-tRNA synthetase beta chain